MCGIVGYTGPGDPKGVLLDGLKKLEYRGYDSSGIAILSKGETEVFRSVGRIANLEKKMAQESFTGCVGIGHTRWATHGAPTENNAHPHKIGHITLVHNGIIENYLDHKEALDLMGRTFESETDTEIVAHLFDLEVSKGRSLKDALKNVLPRLKGAYAFVLFSDKEPDLVIGVCRGAPLVAGVGKGENFLASDVQAILHRTNQIIYLREGQVAFCRSNGVEVYDFLGDRITPEIKSIHWTPDQLDKAGYRHYMEKEIFEQSRAIANTLSGNVDVGRTVVQFPALASFIAEHGLPTRISIVACGTARHAALVGQYFIEKLARIPSAVDFGSEFRYRNPILEPGSMTLVISQSGETADTLAAVRASKERQIPVLAICNVRESSIAREADGVIFTNAGPEIGVASTKAFTTQLVVLLGLAIQLGTENGRLSPSAARELTRDLVQLPIFVDKTLELNSTIEKIATQLQDLNFFFYMGRDLNYPIALEGALKLKEISYAHAEGYAAGELKHGPIALIDRQTAVIVLAPKFLKDQTCHDEATLYEKMLSNLQQVKSRGGIIFSIGCEGDTTLPSESTYFAGIPRTSWAMSPILLSIPVQLLAYHVAVQRGTDIDKPRNLAKSVTVE